MCFGYWSDDAVDAGEAAAAASRRSGGLAPIPLLLRGLISEKKRKQKTNTRDTTYLVVARHRHQPPTPPRGFTELYRVFFLLPRCVRAFDEAHRSDGTPKEFSLLSPLPRPSRKKRPQRPLTDHPTNVDETPFPRHKTEKPAIGKCGPLMAAMADPNRN